MFTLGFEKTALSEKTVASAFEKVRKALPRQDKISRSWGKGLAKSYAKKHPNGKPVKTERSMAIREFKDLHRRAKGRS